MSCPSTVCMPATTPILIVWVDENQFSCHAATNTAAITTITTTIAPSILLFIFCFPLFLLHCEATVYKIISCNTFSAQLESLQVYFDVFLLESTCDCFLERFFLHLSLW